MADAVTAALMKEAGQARRATDAVAQAGDAVRALNDPNIGAEDSPAQQQERQAAIAQQAKIAGTPPPAVAPTPVSASQQAANDPVTAALLGEAKGGASDAIPGNEGAQDASRNVGKSNEEGLLTRAKGVGEAGLALATGAVGSIVGAAGGLLRGVTGGKYGTAEGGKEAAARAAEIAASLTFAPRTETGQDVLKTLGDIAGATKLAGLGPSEAITLGGLAAGPRAAQASVPRGTPQAVPGKMGSVGASGVAPAEQAAALVQQLSPELRPFLQKDLQKMGGKVSPANVKTLERHVDADTLPVRVSLMEGQATGDVTKASNQFNSKGKYEQVANRFKEQNEQLIGNTNAIRESAAPDVYVTAKPEIGELIIDAYKAKDAALTKNISAQYQALRDANGGAFPLDAKAFVASADAALHKGLLYDHLPPAIRSTMDRVAKDGMTFENFESLRTNLARMQRSQTIDGNAKAAAGAVRDALEALPLPPEAAHLKPLADAARAAAKERFALIEGDPAYKAITRGKASADHFIEKYVLAADKKNVQTMKANLAHDEVSQQAMAVGAMQRLKESAKIVDDKGVFNQAGYNKTLEGLHPKLQIIFKPEDMANIDKLGRVANYVKGQDSGTFFNNSGSWIAAMAEAAKQGAAGAVNVAAHGVPIGTWGRKGLGYLSEQRDLNRALKPGAGFTLKEIAGGSK